jgi:tRNA-specific 2-thiouridylase
MKFGRVLQRAEQLGFDKIATGHHARIVATPEGSALARGLDPAKDQSYVLYMLGAHQLARTLLPVGELTKADVRERARALGLRTADKRESMDVCFITKHGRETFLGARIPRRPGSIVDASGAIVGEHDGVDAFTIGQRRKTGVAVGERRYVVDIETSAARVTVGTRDELLRDRVRLIAPSFARTPPAEPRVQTRAHGTPVTARLDGDVVIFATPQPRVAPGQVVAIYDGDICCGGGIAAA